MLAQAEYSMDLGRNYYRVYNVEKPKSFGRTAELHVVCIGSTSGGWDGKMELEGRYGRMGVKGGIGG